MAIVKKGTLTVVLGGAAQNLNLGFVPSYIKFANKTKIVANTNGIQAWEWYDDMVSGSAYIWTMTAGAPVLTYTAANGVTPFQTGDAALWTPTNITITGISQAANAVVTATNTLAIGDTVTFSGVVGMVQINQLRGKVLAAAAGNFTVDINTTGFTAYGSGGIANLISNTQTNVGQIGLTLGTTVMVTTNNVIEYVAYLDAPFTS
jgi:hypothetical protein